MTKKPSRQPHSLFVSPELAALVVSFAGGICLAEKFNFHYQVTLPTTLILIVLTCIFHRLKRLQSDLINYPVVCLIFLLIGHQYYLNRAIPTAAPNHLFNQVEEPQVMTLYGILDDYPLTDNSTPSPKTIMIMETAAVYRDSFSHSDPKGSSATCGLVQLSLDGLLPNEMKPGDHFLAKAKISRIQTFSVPGSFNYKRHMANKGIFLKGWISSPADIIKINTGKQREISSTWLTLRDFPRRFRSRIAAFLNNNLTQPAKGLYKAILIGDRHDIDSSVIENFIKSGCIHILAISGMHMGLLAFVFITGMSWVLKRSTWLLLQVNVRKISLIVSLIPLTIYAFIAGLNLPVLRALLMTTIFITAILLDRPGNIINHILAAALLILAWNPAVIFSAAFQLSFSAVTAIALVCPLLTGLLLSSPANPKENKPASTKTEWKMQMTAAKTLRWIVAGIMAATAALAGTLPLLLFHFNRISLVAPFANLLVEPLICLWSLVIGIAACLFIQVLPYAAKLLFSLGGAGLITAEKICAYFANLTYASLRLPTPSLPEITIYYIFLLSLILFFHMRNKLRLFSIMTAGAALFALFLIPAVVRVRIRTSPATSITVLDVGHGSSTLVQLPYGKNILIDGGGSGNETFNIGERVIGPFLWHKQILHLDAVIITHPHADHYNGLPFILRHFTPRELWINGLAPDDPQYRQMIILARSLGIEIKVPLAGDILAQRGFARLQCIHNGLFPDNISGGVYSSAPVQETDINDTSLVLRLDTDYLSFLFPADISSKKSACLVAEGKNLHADVLLAPHHGSRSSMSRQLIRAVAPKYIAISVGRNNPFGLPDKSFQSYIDSNITVLTTGRDGTLTFGEKDGEMIISRYQIN